MRFLFSRFSFHVIHTTPFFYMIMWLFSHNALLTIFTSDYFTRSISFHIHFSPDDSALIACDSFDTICLFPCDFSHVIHFITPSEMGVILHYHSSFENIFTENLCELCLWGGNWTPSLPNMTFVISTRLQLGHPWRKTLTLGPHFSLGLDPDCESSKKSGFVAGAEFLGCKLARADGRLLSGEENDRNTKSQTGWQREGRGGEGSGWEGGWRE